MVYSDKGGVSYRRYEDDHEPGDEPEVDETDARLEELYFETYNGKLTVSIDTESEGFVSIEIPVLPVDGWNNFVESLPEWVIE